MTIPGTTLAGTKCGDYSGNMYSTSGLHFYIWGEGRKILTSGAVTIGDRLWCLHLCRF